MSPQDTGGDALRAFDRHAGVLAEDCRGRFERGGDLADDDIGILFALAHRLRRDVEAWAGCVDAMELAVHSRLAPQVAAQQLLEGVFDSALTADGLRVLGSALDLAFCGR